MSNLSYIAPLFRALRRTNKVLAIWIIKKDGLLDSPIGKNFLIKNTVKAGALLIAPSEDWVSEGAFIAMIKQDGGIHLVVNKSAADALSLAVPEKYAERTQFLTAN